MLINFFMNGQNKAEITLSVCGILALFAGVLNGFIGTGGGVIMLLILRYLYKTDEKSAYASVAAVVLPMAVISAAIYCFRSPELLYSALPFLPFALAGGALGAFLLGKVKTRAVSYIFSALAVFAGASALVR